MRTGWMMKYNPQFLPGFYQYMFLPLRQSRAGPINIKIQHRHRGLEWTRFAALAAHGRTFQRKRDFMGILHFKDATFQVQGVAIARHFGRPPGAWLSGAHAKSKSIAFKELHLSFMPLGRVQRLKCPQVLARSRFGIAFA
jgi:hypothetical protein